MKPSTYHAVMWLQRHAPACVKSIKLPLLVNIHQEITARGGRKFTTSQHNALAILTNKRATQKRDRKPEAELVSVLVNYTCPTQPATACIIQRVGRKMKRALRRRNPTSH